MSEQKKIQDFEMGEAAVSSSEDKIEPQGDPISLEDFPTIDEMMSTVTSANQTKSQVDLSALDELNEENQQVSLDEEPTSTRNIDLSDSQDSTVLEGGSSKIEGSDSYQMTDLEEVIEDQKVNTEAISTVEEPPQEDSSTTENLPPLTENDFLKAVESNQEHKENTEYVEEDSPTQSKAELKKVMQEFEHSVQEKPSEQEVFQEEPQKTPTLSQDVSQSEVQEISSKPASTQKMGDHVFDELRHFGETGEEVQSENLQKTDPKPEEDHETETALSEKQDHLENAEPTLSVNKKISESCVITSDSSPEGYKISVFYSPLSQIVKLDGGTDPLNEAVKVLWKKSQESGANALVDFRWSLTHDDRMIVSVTPVTCHKE